MKVLFVCTGNSCRSPMAKALFKKMAEEQNLHVEVDSCGTATLVGMSASKDAIEALRREGIDISGHKSKPINKELVDWADLIFVMERRHLDRILEDFPEARAKVHLLSKYANDEEKDIIDPIGKPREVYEELLLTLKFYLPKVIERIKNESSFSK